MTDQPLPRRPARLPILISLLVGLLVGGGSLQLIHSSMLEDYLPWARQGAAGSEQVAFLPMEQMLVSLPPGGRSRHLRLTAQLEVSGGRKAAVERVMPRIQNMMHGYLRAVEPAELEKPSALVLVRAQLLRRIQLITGEGHVNDLLITEFTLG